MNDEEEMVEGNWENKGLKTSVVPGAWPQGNSALLWLLVSPAKVSGLSGLSSPKWLQAGASSAYSNNLPSF